MKSTIQIDEEGRWMVTLTPQTLAEKAMIEMARKGYNVQVTCGGTTDSAPLEESYLRIFGDGWDTRHKVE